MKRVSSFVILTLLPLLLAVPVVKAVDADSLRRVIASTNSTGQQKSEAYENLYQELFNYSDADQLLALLEEWMAFERQEGNVDKEAIARWGKIAVLSNYGLDEAMIIEAPVQMKWFEEHEMWERYYSTWDSKASSYLYTDKVQTALHEARLMLEDAQERNNNYGRVVSYMLTGIIYESMSQNTVAIENLERAYSMVGREKTNSDIYFIVCDYLCQTLDSEERYERELELTNEWEQEIVQRKPNEPDNPTYLQGTSLSCYVQRASALKGLGRIDEAWVELNKAKECLQHANQPLARYRVLFCQARLLIAQGKNNEALQWIDSLQTMSMEVGGSLDYLRADVLMDLGRYAEAANLYRKEYLRQDSVFGRDMRMQLDELTTLYKLDETAMKDQRERQRVRSRFIVIIFSLLVLGLLLFLIHRYIAAKRLAHKNRQLREANEQLRLANERVEGSSKMKSDFIKSISHEIRTPLNILSGFTQVVTSPDANLSEEQLVDIHQRINENTDRIVQLVNKMLELTDANSQTVIEREDNVLAGDIVADTIHKTRIASTSDVVFSWEPDALASTVLKTHRKYAVRALACLLDNAIKFTPKGMIALRLVEKDGFLLFAVEDTGVGVPSDQADHIFEEFFQLDQYTDGAGIGLTVARGIARRLGGDICLDTDYTAGARFVLSLPI